jgi:hypothetical protein
MRIPLIHAVIASSAFLFAGGAVAAPAAPVAARITLSAQQGMHQWPALDGKLVLVAGANMDILLYERTLNFYFVQKSGPEWIHVPVVEGKNAFTPTLRSAATGETTTSDAVVVVHGKDVYLVRAAFGMKKASIATTTYKFGEAGDEYPDGPWFLFKEVSRNSYPAAKSSVEEVLQKEAQRKPAK